jgi:Flp pilus assembly protein TadD
VNRQQRRAAAKRTDQAAPGPSQSAVEGLRHHQAGRLDLAASHYLKALAERPNDPDVLYLLGALRHQQGNPVQAVELIGKSVAIKPTNPEAHSDLGVALAALGRADAAVNAYRQAIAIRPDYPETHNNLGNALRTIGRLDDAATSLRQAIALKPTYPEAHNNLGVALRDLGRLAEAEASHREAIRLRPNYPEAHCNLGAVLHALGRLAEAEASCRQALRLRPNHPDAHNSLGGVLWSLGRAAEAEASCRQALRLRPDYPEAHNNLGGALWAVGRLDEAEECCRQALRLRPDYPEAHNNLGNALRDLGRPEEAEASCREALRLRPDYPDAHSNLGAALYSLGRSAEAEESCREAGRLSPDYPDAHTNLAHALLLAGRFEEGWSEYEWRWKTRQLADGARNFPVPQWSGEPIGERTILLHAEQGLGDTLQFCRYLPLMAPGVRIVLEAQAPLVRLLSRLPGVTQIIAQGERLPPFDLHCPLLSLPRAFGTTLDSIPATTPYLAADPPQAAHWRERIAGLPGMRVGLVWAGGQRHGLTNLIIADRRRSITLDAMAPLAEASGISFISLQKGEPAAQAAHPPAGMALHDFTADLHDFADTAALIDGLDLVISVDTAVAHLAGALGKPVWLLNRFDTDWRWLLNRDDSPWYPTLRQFRQPAPGDWTSVLHASRDALRQLADSDRDQLRPRQA